MHPAFSLAGANQDDLALPVGFFFAHDPTGDANQPFWLSFSPASGAEPDSLPLSYVDLTDPAEFDIAGAPTLLSATEAPSLSTEAPMNIYTSGRDSHLFNIEVDFQGTWTWDLQQAYVTAVQRVESIIQDDLPDVYAWVGDALKHVDDIVITASLKAIDGVGGILGQSGPTALRLGSYLPAAAMMQFDSADAEALAASGLWDKVVLHEMLHAVGFGSLWSMLHLVSDQGTANPTYVGKAGEAAYAQLTGAVGPLPVPVESQGGAGTADSHWSEAVFHDELMTGWLGSTDPLSAMTAASLADLGYGLAPRSNWAVDEGLNSGSSFGLNMAGTEDRATVAYEVSTDGGATRTSTTAAQGDLQPAPETTLDPHASDVARLYYGLLDRAPDAEGLQAWTHAVAAGTSLQSVAQAFLDSGEYVAQFGTPSDMAFLDAVYQKALGRSVDAEGLQSWTEALAHGATRAEVAVEIIESTEAQQHFIPQIDAGWHLV